MDTGGGADARSDAPELASALDGLKRRGSALLVVGSVPADVYRRASARMLGDGDRRRLVVTGVSDCQDSRLEAVPRRTPEWTRIVEFEAPARSTAAAVCTDDSTTSPAGPESPAESAPARDPLANRVDGDVVELGREVAKTIAQFDSIAGGLSPAELRLAFDCLSVILAECDLETAFRFSHVLANHVRSVDGMAHFWLPRELDDEAVRVLEPLFDAVVELRLDGTELQQRWHFRDVDLTSEWLVL
jgi:hypothetical protein